MIIVPPADNRRLSPLTPPTPPPFSSFLRSPSPAHRPGFQPRRAKQRQLGVGGHEGVRRRAVDAHRRHLLAARAAARIL